MKKVLYVETSVKTNKDTSDSIPLVGGIFEEILPDTTSTPDSSEPKVDVKKIEAKALAVWLGEHKITKKSISTILDGKGSPKIRESFYGSPKTIFEKSSFKSLTRMSKASSENLDVDIVSFVDVFAMGDVILIPKNLSEEDTKDFLIAEVADLIDQKYPIYVAKSWESEFIRQLLKTSLTKLAVLGNTPYREAYKFLVDVSSVEDMLVKSYGKQRFIEEYKRAPQIETLWKIIDIKAFNMKSWGPLVNFFGGKDKFEQLSIPMQEAVIHMYEIVGTGTQDVYKHLVEVDNFKQLYSIPFKELAVSRVKNKFSVNSVSLIKALKTLSKAAPQNLSKLVIYSALFSSLSKKDFNLDASCEDQVKLLGAIQGGQYKVQTETEALANKAASMWLSPTSFAKYSEEFLSNMKGLYTKPKHYPTVSGKIEGTDYAWESMDLTNPHAWFVGLETNCCQHLGSVGGACVRYAAKNPDISGIFRVTKKGKTIAQSWFWFDIFKGNFVFDNIEALGRDVRDVILQCYTEFTENELKPRAKLFGIKEVCVGLAYGSSDITGLKKFSSPTNKSVITSAGRGSCYSDAGSQVCIAKFK